MKWFLVILTYTVVVGAQTYEAEVFNYEKDFMKIENEKKLRAQERSKGLETYLQKKDALAAQKKKELEAYLDQKRKQRGPASTDEDEHDHKMRAYQIENERARNEYLREIELKEIAKRKVQSAFDSPEQRRRENKPWR